MCLLTSASKNRTRDVTPPLHSSFNTQRPSSQSLPAIRAQLRASSDTSIQLGTRSSSPVTSKKREHAEIVDLTLDDSSSSSSEPPEHHVRKKSRSSSHSTDIEAKTKQLDLVKKASSKPGRSLRCFFIVRNCILFSESKYKKILLHSFPELLNNNLDSLQNQISEDERESSTFELIKA